MKKVFSLLKKNRTSRKLEHLEKSEVFCMAPWVSLHVGPRGHVFPCCIAAHDLDESTGIVSENSLEECWNSERFRELRKNMLSGKKDSMCKLCYEYQEIGKVSPRMEYNKDFSHHFDLVSSETSNDGKLDSFQPRFVDFRLSNLCNFKCRICSHHFSSSWFQDAKALGTASENSDRLVVPVENVEELWTQIEPLLDGLEKVHFAGGEPLIMEEHYRILYYLMKKEKFDVNITYNTNFSEMKFKGQDVIEMWKHFKEVTVCASLDGMGKRGEFMRKGQNWEQTERNRMRMLEVCPHVRFILTPAVGILNVLHLPDFFSNWVDRGLLNPTDINIYVVFEPDFYNIQHLPENIKEAIREKYQSFFDSYVQQFNSKARKHIINQFSQVTNHLDKKEKFQKEIELWEGFTFETYNRKLDTLRSENLLEVFPELTDLYSRN